MTSSSRTVSSVTRPVAAAWFASSLTALTCLSGLSGLMTTAAMAAAPDAPAPAVASYTVSQSTPIDKVLLKVYANSPLNAQVLRKALVDANPKVMTGNPQQRIKAGTVLQVPDHAHLVRTALQPFSASPDTYDSGPSARDPSARKHWVRFP